MNASYDSRKIARAAGTRQCGGALKFSGLSIDFYGMLGRGAQKKKNRQKHERGRLPGLIQPFVDQMKRGSVHVKSSQKIFKNIYARIHTFHRMGASQERAAFFNATLLVTPISREVRNS